MCPMNLDDIFEIYQLVNSSVEQNPTRKQAMELRKSALESQISGFSKVAFDTRRINQNTQYNPRRNLQYYIRGPAFIDSQDESKIKSLAKLKEVVGTIKDEFIGEPEWFDSYASDLDHSLEKIFYVADGKNFDFSVPAIQHLEQVLDARYRLSLANINSSTHEDLRKLIIHKDERLEKSAIYKSKGLSKINKNVKPASPTVEKQIISVPHLIDNKSKKIADMMNGLIDSVFKDENRLEELKSEENDINSKRASLDNVKRDKETLRKTVLEKTSQERVMLQNLWSYYNSIQKLLIEKQQLENVVAFSSKEIDNLSEKVKRDKEILNDLASKLKTTLNKTGQDLLKDQQSSSLKRMAAEQDKIKQIEVSKQTNEKLINTKMTEIRSFNNGLIKERPLYDSVNADKLITEKKFEEKVAEEKTLIKEFATLEANVNKINKERLLIQSRLKSNLEKMNALKSIDE